MKIVINKCYGGFGLSKQAVDLFIAKGGTVERDEYDDPNKPISGYEIGYDRTNPVLVEVVEQLGEAADTDASELKVVEIPDDVEYTIEDYDGIEWVAEVHRTWR